MKRSEMVQMIAEHLPESDVWIDEEEKVNHADFILSQIEKLGMLPPRTKLSHLQVEDNAWDPENDSLLGP